MLTKEELIEEIASYKEIFHSTPAYIIDYRGGSSGAFITTLVNFFVWNNDIEINSKLSEFNNSHKALNHYNWDESGHKFAALDRLMCPNVSLYVRPKDENKPIIFHSHCTPNWDNFFYRWPKGKAIKVTYRHLDIPEITFNVLWKLQIESFDLGGHQQWWIDLKERFPTVLAKYQRPHEMSSKDLKIVLSEEIEAAMIPEVVDTVNPVAKTEHMVLKLPYSMIASSPEEVLSLIENHLELPTPVLARKYYDQYIENQNKLVAEKAPWLRLPNFGN